MNMKTSAVAISLFSLILPLFAIAQVGIPCDGPNCTFNDLITLANRIIRFLMIDVAVPLAALGFMYAGARLVIFQNKEGEWTKAKEIFGDIALGFGIILGAYVLIKTVLFAFLSAEQVTFMQFMFQ